MFRYWNLLKCFNFTPRYINEKMSVTDHRNVFNLGKTAFHENNQGKSRGLGWEKLVQDFRLLFWLKFLLSFSLLMVAFGECIFQKDVTNQLFRREFRAVQLVLLYPRQHYAQINFCKKSPSYTIGWTVRGGKIATNFQLIRLWKFPNKIW